MFGQQTSRGPRSRVRRGQDALVRLDLELAEAAFGTTKPLRVDTAVLCPRCNGSGASEGSKPVKCATCHGQGEVTHVQRSFIGDIRTTSPCPTCRGYGTVIPNPCVECSGDGRVRSNRTINVKIPPGVSSGNRIHLAAHGEVGPGGGPAGDLYVELDVVPHEVFRRDGDNLEMVLQIPMTAAALGTEVQMRPLEADLDGADGDETTATVTVPSGTQSGTRIALEGKGVPRLRSHGRGQLGVTLLVQTPTKLDKEQRELLRELAELREETSVQGSVQKHTPGLLRSTAGRVRRPVSAPVFHAELADPLPPVGSTVVARRTGGAARRRGAADPTGRDGACSPTAPVGPSSDRVVDVGKQSISIEVAEHRVEPADRPCGWWWPRRWPKAIAGSWPSSCSPRSA